MKQVRNVTSTDSRLHRYVRKGYQIFLTFLIIRNTVSTAGILNTQQFSSRLLSFWRLG